MLGGRALVTGATGGLGRALLDKLPARGVTALVRGDCPAGLAGTILRADIAEASWHDLVAPRDVVFHLAAWVHRPAMLPAEIERAYEVNAAATARLAQACREAGAKLVFASTISVHGDGVAAAAPGGPTTAYGRSKLAGEAAIRAEGEKGLRYAILRFPLMYGVFGRGNMERMLRAITRRVYWPVGDPNTRKSCLFFADAASALLLAARAPAAEQGTHVVSAERACTLAEIHSAAYRSLGRTVPAFSIPRPVAMLVAGGADLGLRVLGRPPRLAQQVRTLVAPAWVDGSGFAALTGFRATVSLDEGLRRTAAWLCAREGQG
jgi:UDP-glucose 4-epimerase